MQMILAQNARDNNVSMLVDSMLDAYSDIHLAPVEKIETQCATINVLMDQMAQCGDFICDYTKHKSICTLVILCKQMIFLFVVVISYKSCDKCILGC
jgi:hypothetical protein